MDKKLLLILKLFKRTLIFCANWVKVVEFYVWDHEFICRMTFIQPCDCYLSQKPLSAARDVPLLWLFCPSLWDMVHLILDIWYFYKLFSNFTCTAARLMNWYHLKAEQAYSYLFPADREACSALQNDLSWLHLQSLLILILKKNLMAHIMLLPVKYQMLTE